jgi:hypothetical protein
LKNWPDPKDSRCISEGEEAMPKQNARKNLQARKRRRMSEEREEKINRQLEREKKMGAPRASGPGHGDKGQGIVS